MKPKYGWVHVIDWFPSFLALAVGSLVLLSYADARGETILAVFSVLGLVASFWPLSGYLLSWAKKETDIWYRELVSKAVLNGNEHVLDVGCGLARSTVALAKAATKGIIVGVDVFSKRSLWGNSLEQASRNAEIEGVADRTSFKYGGAVSLPFEDDRFDVVVAAYVTHELRQDRARLAMMSEALRVLKPGGRFVAGEIPRSSETFLRYLWFGFWFLPLDYLVKLRQRAGFSNIEVSRLGRPVVICAAKPFPPSARQES